MIKKTTLVLFIAFTAITGFAQKKGTKPAPTSDFNTKEAERLLVKALKFANN